MPAKLRVTPLSGEPFELTIGNTATIGRTSDNIVCLSGSPLVSRQHALVRCHDGYQYQIIDLGSRNGTFVNDQRVVMPMTLAHGARILIAKNELVFEQIEDDFSNAHLEVTLAGLDRRRRLRDPAGGIVSLRYSRLQHHGGENLQLRSRATARRLVSRSRQSRNQERRDDRQVHRRRDARLLERQCGEEEVDCAATLRIARDLLGLAGKTKWANGEPFHVGIALHYGSVTCGNVGLDAQRDATIIGDVVNTVFRLESVMKELNQQVLLSADFRRSPASKRKPGRSWASGN